MTQSSASRRRLGRRVLALLAVAGAVVASTATIATATPPSPSPSTPTPTTVSAPTSGTVMTPHAQLDRTGTTQHYAIPKPNCGPPAPGHRSCLSARLVRVAKGTPGALAYSAPAYKLGPHGGYTPGDLATAYGYTPSASAGAGQTVAIIDAYDDSAARSELDVFDHRYGLPAETGTSFRKVNQAGKASPLPALDTGWAEEIALDIEAVRGVCNKCHILLVEANSTSDSDLAKAVDTAARMGATEISNSYGGPDAMGGQPTSGKATAAAYNHPGIVITASTGDHGWYDWDLANDGSHGWSDNAPNAPASYPTVVGVGGTTLSLNSNGTRSREVVWNEDGRDDRIGLTRVNRWHGDQGASGGGCSTVNAAPSFQASAVGYAQLGCKSGMRSTGDVAALADPFTGYDVYDSFAPNGGGWVTAGGTSLSSPLIAAMWALAGGSGGVSYPAQNLYDHLRWAPSSIYDVTSGGNGFCGGDSAAGCSAYLNGETSPATTNPNGIDNGNPFYPAGWAGMLDCSYTKSGLVVLANQQCNAAAGFDGPSGVGTPHGLSAFKRFGPSISVTWPSLIKRRTAVTFRATGFTDPMPGATAATYHWTWGDGTSTTTLVPSATHTFTQGHDLVSVRVVDTAGRSSRSIAKRYAIGYLPTAKASGPTSARRGASVAYTAKVTEPNTGGRITSYTWRVGNTVVGRRARLVHHFTAKGTFKVTLTVTDNSGLSGKSNTVTVKAT